jgi:Fur family ferric uptake transcriptional regulator
VSAENLFSKVTRTNHIFSFANTFSMHKFLPECALLSERHFDEGQARYEVIGEHHHDHFICESCGKIIEFEDDALERLQRNVARKLGVTLHLHKLELYGRCVECRDRAADFPRP